MDDEEFRSAAREYLVHEFGEPAVQEIEARVRRAIRGEPPAGVEPTISPPVPCSCHTYGVFQPAGRSVH